MCEFLGTWSVIFVWKMENFISGTWHFIYCLRRPPMRGFNFSRTLQHWFMNITTADLENLRPYFLLYQSKGDRDTELGALVMCHEVWPKPRWISHGGFQHLSTTQCLNQHWHIALQLLAGESQILLPQNFSSAFWSCWSFCTQNIILNCASWHWCVPVPPDLAAQV